MRYLLPLCLLLAACGGEDLPNSAPPPAPLASAHEATGAPRDHLDLTREALDSLATGHVSDSLLLASMPQIEREWSMQYQVFAGAESPLAKLYHERLELATERACEGDTAMARAVLLYGLFVGEEEADRYFAGDQNRPDLNARCAQAQVFCAAYEQLTAERGEEALERLDQTCQRTRLGAARRTFARWDMRNLSPAADRDLLASMPITLHEFEQQRVAFTDPQRPALVRAADARLRQVARRACEGSRPMAHAYLRYWLLADRRGLGEDVPPPSRLDTCPRPQTFCAVMPDLVSTYGEDAIRLTSEVCSL